MTDIGNAVGLLPLKEVDGDGRLFAVDDELFDFLAGCAPNVAVRRSLLVDRRTEFETCLDGGGAHIKQSGRDMRYFSIRHIDMGRAESIDRQADRLSNADSIGNLDKGAVGNAGSNKVLGYVTSGIGCRAVDFRGSLPENAPPP